MRLYPERLVADLSRLPGADHSFLKQLCAGDGAPVRAALARAVGDIGTPFDIRAIELLSSLDNRRFFQGFAETAALHLLHGDGWKLRAMAGPGPRLEVGKGGGPSFSLSVLAFLHQTRPGGDEQTRRRLEAGLARVASRHRFVVLIRRWLPHDADVEPVRRAIEMWLGQVQSGTWEGRYAAYEDDKVALEFCLTRERAKGGESPLALVLGPFAAHRAMEVIEPRVVRELDRHAAGPARGQPLVVACVSDQPWNINDGYLRDFLYGRPNCTLADGGVSTWTFGDNGGPCAFRDPLYSAFSALLLIDREPSRPTTVRARALFNPWARVKLGPADIGVRAFATATEAAEVSAAAAPPTLRWYAGRGEEFPIG